MRNVAPLLFLKNNTSPQMQEKNEVKCYIWYIAIMEEGMCYILRDRKEIFPPLHFVV